MVINLNISLIKKGGGEMWLIQKQTLKKSLKNRVIFPLLPLLGEYYGGRISGEGGQLISRFIEDIFDCRILGLRRLNNKINNNVL